jgi:hypothetical protein
MLCPCPALLNSCATPAALSYHHRQHPLPRSGFVLRPSSGRIAVRNRMAGFKHASIVDE